MTETSTAATVARPDAFRFGTVGKAFHEAQIKIAEDGEVLVKGPNVFQGYYKNQEATKETIVDGWLHTGDIGEFDPDGYLKITGRKKDIIITAGGKNITPANLEAEMKQSQWISQCVVVGDRKPSSAPCDAGHGGVASWPRRRAGRPTRPGWPRTPTCARWSSSTSTSSTRSSPASSR
jgi:long-subunit acyl-CoA synthetase (AMP-forming)